MEDKFLENRKIVYIMTDTQRWDMLNCYRETGLKTPHLDHMASEGIRYSRAYTTSPVCEPARSCIFTGMYPHSNGGWSNGAALGDNVHTIGERLQDKGIHTAYIGKWHLDGSDYFGLGRCPKGWDNKYWYDGRNYLEELSDEDRVMSRKAESMEKRDFPPEFTFAHKCVDRAIDFLNNHGDEDFFLAVSIDEPHAPSLCPREFYEMYEDFEFPKSPNIYDTLENKPDYQKAWAGDKLYEDKDALELKSKYFFGCNSFVDYEIGRVLDKIERVAPDAFVIYTSDHGALLDSHSLYHKGACVYEECAHIPFIIKGKGIPRNMVDEAPVSHVNIAPTIFELFGFELPKVFAGKSLLPQIEKKCDQVNDYVFIEFGRFETDHDHFGGFQPMRAVFDGRYKLSINLLSTDELYDLKSDPSEMINLIDSPLHEAVRDRLHDAILANMNNTRDPFRGYYWERRPWRKNARPATWHYTGMSRQREEEEYEPRQLNFYDGLIMKEPTRAVTLKARFG